MELKYADLSTLHFPKQEWQWLRPATALSPNTPPDFYLWGVQVDEKIWCWHPSGGALVIDDQATTTPTTIPVLLLNTGASELAAFGLYLKTTFTSSTPIDAEWVSALGVLKQRFNYALAEHELPPYWKEALEVAGLKPHLGVLAQRSRFCFLNSTELQFLYSKRWDLSVLELVETWDVDTRELFVAAISKWNLSANHTKEITHFILILLKRFGQASTKNLLTGTYQNGEEFRAALLQTAQPELANLSRARLEKLRALKLPPRTSVYGDPSFESDVLKITHNPRNSTDFQLFKSWVEDPQIGHKIQELLEIYQ